MQTHHHALATWGIVALALACNARPAVEADGGRRASMVDGVDAADTERSPEEGAAASTAAVHGPDASEDVSQPVRDRAETVEGTRDATAVEAGAEAGFADVTGVRVSGAAGAYTFSVSVMSSDVDCSHFTDWWEVLDADGQLLYRRILAHSHTDENGTSDADAPGNTFTRSGGPVVVEPDARVLVRAHLNDSGYRGQAMVGSVETAFEPAEPFDDDFASAVEAEAPQPSGCDF